MSQTGSVEPEPAPSGGFLDSEEVVAALDSLSAQDKLKLYAIEKYCLRGTDLSPKELLHEAMCSVIMGDRKCPRRVSPMAFIVQTMRSLAGHQRTKRSREMADGGASQDAVDGAVMFSSAPSTPEEILIEQQSQDTIRVIQGCFEGDEQAQLVILGWSEGYRGKELREFVGVDQAALDYAIKRIGRTMMKRYPDGWKKP
jgi:DNA-directed RNA polymerase specialized sigma24 family protein